MAHPPCPSGARWDSLTNNCMPLHYLLPAKPTTGTSPVLPRQTPMASPPDDVPGISVTVWICVAAVVSGSLLVVLFFFILYRRQVGHFHSAADKEAQASDSATLPPAPMASSPAVVVLNRDPHSFSSCPHPNGGIGGFSQEEGSNCGEVSGCSSSPHACHGRTEGGIPLPATELGGAALVTTKTVQYIY